MDERPAQPPEGKLIANATAARGLSIREASRRAGISYGRWRQITSGYQNVSPGSYAVVRAPARTLARMAYVVGITPERLEAEGQRPDAAEALREIIRSQPAEVPDEEPPEERAHLGLAAVDPADPVRWREWVTSLTDAERDLLAEAMREYPLDPVAWHLWLTPRITTAERRALVEALQALRRGENPSREATA